MTGIATRSNSAVSARFDDCQDGIRGRCIDDNSSDSSRLLRNHRKSGDHESQREPEHREPGDFKSEYESKHNEPGDYESKDRWSDPLSRRTTSGQPHNSIHRKHNGDTPESDSSDKSMVAALESSNPAGNAGMIATLNGEISQDNSILAYINSQTKTITGLTAISQCAIFGP
jgi:hypothetical protein